MFSGIGQPRETVLGYGALEFARQSTFGLVLGVPGHEGRDAELPGVVGGCFDFQERTPGPGGDLFPGRAAAHLVGSEDLIAG